MDHKTKKARKNCRIFPNKSLQKKAHRAIRLWAAIFLVAFGIKPCASEETFPGNPSRIAYETGMIAYLRSKPKRARLQFQKSLEAGGPYADLSRLMLLRLAAHETKGNLRPEPDLKNLLSGFEDERLLPLAWFAVVQALYESGRKEEALQEALEFHLRFSESELEDDAILVAVRILYERRSYEAALDLIAKTEAQGKGFPDRLAELLFYKAQIYLSPGNQNSPFRACAALKTARQLPGFALLPLQNRILDFYFLHCGAPYGSE